MSDAVTREEQYYRAILGAGTAPTPITRKEKWLNRIAEALENAGTGGGGATPIVFTTMDMQTATCNKTFEEVMTDINNLNFDVVCHLDIAYIKVSVCNVGTHNGVPFLYFQFMFGGPVIMISYYPDGSIEISTQDNNN